MVRKAVSLVPEVVVLHARKSCRKISVFGGLYARPWTLGIGFRGVQKDIALLGALLESDLQDREDRRRHHVRGVCWSSLKWREGALSSSR